MPYPLTATPASSYDPRYGGIPAVPSPISTAQEAVVGNIGNLGNLYTLAGGVNRFNQQQAPLGLEMNLPGYQGMIGQSSRNIAANLAGQVPPDVVNLIAQQAAERGTATGLGTNAPNVNAALLRALGLTSLGQQQLGEQELTAAIGRTPQGPLFDPSKFFVTPEQEQQAQAAANLYKSAPVPSAAAAEARKQAAAGIGATVGAPGVQLPAGSPFKATTWSAPTSISPTGFGPSGSSYTPSSGIFNVTGNTIGGGPASLGTGGGRTYMGPADQLYPGTEVSGLGSLGDILGPAAPDWTTPPGTYAPGANPLAPPPNTTTITGGGIDWGDPFGLGAGAGLTGGPDMVTAPPTSLGDLFGTLTPEDLDYFG